MDFDIELRFQKVLKGLEPNFGGGLDVQAVLFLIGVNELGIGYKDFSKAEKQDLLHVAICTLLEPLVIMNTRRGTKKTGLISNS